MGRSAPAFTQGEGNYANITADDLAAALKGMGEFAKGDAAGVAGYPVDIVSALLRFGGKGLDLGKDSDIKGSSAWWRKLMGVPEDSIPALAGEFASPDPLDAAKLSMLLFHGSPHLFNKFDASRIGTGEGSQAFGHGLYAAENKAVGKEYQEGLSRYQPVYEGEISPEAVDVINQAWRASDIDDPQKLRESDLREWLETLAADTYHNRNTSQKGRDALADELLALDPGKLTMSPGHLYEVDVPDEHIAGMLDWDKPLMHQPKSVQAAIMKAYEGSDYTPKPGDIGSELYGGLKVDDSRGAGAPVSEKLRELGIPGIKYYDEASRPANVVEKKLKRLVEKHGGDVEAAVDEHLLTVHLPPKEKAKTRAGLVKDLKQNPSTRNFVIFDPEHMTIVSRNGKPVNGARSIRRESAKKPPSIGNMWDQVTDPKVAAAMARRGEHIKRGPTGEIIGAPRGTKSGQTLAKLRRDADAKIEQGEYGMGWYDEARDVNNEFSNGDPVKASFKARIGAAYSPQAQPRAELAGAMKQHNAKVLTGRDVRGRTKPQMRNVRRGYIPDGQGGYKLDPQGIQLAKKTGPYGEGMDPTIPDEDLFKTANDIQHGRLMGYQGAEGKKFSRGFSKTEHGYLIGENLLLGDRARARDVAAGRTRKAAWTPKSAQAAGWVVERRDDYINDAVQAHAKETRERVKQNRVRARRGLKPLKMPEPLDMEKVTADATERSKRGQRDAANYNSAYINQEGHGTLHDLGMFAKDDVPIGEEKATQVLMSRKGHSTPQYELDALHHDALVNALIDEKLAGTGSRIHTSQGQPVGKLNTLVSEGRLAPNSVAALEKSGLSVISHPENTVITRLDRKGKPIAGTVKDLEAELGKTGEQGKVLRGTVETIVEPTRLDSKPGQGTATRNLLKRSGEFGKTVKNLEERTAGAVASRAKIRLELNDALEKATGKAQRQDLRKLLGILSTGGTPAVRRYVKQYGYKGLPSVLLGYLGLQAAQGEASPDA